MKPFPNAIDLYKDRLIRILMCWEGEEKEITFVEETKDT